ncbi:MAG: pancreas/duodenum homeobox protein 1 [Desulfobulbus sp.]|nr:pancreas/duodenum homeobox protein 1 [Desulfobulbus sp.]
MQPAQIFTPTALATLFPPERTHDFFDALFGDAEEGAYDITLSFEGYDEGKNSVRFLLNLHERPGRCLACNLTHGLPEVFKRHPIINVKGLVEDIVQLLGDGVSCEDWQLGSTIQKGRALHCIPVLIKLKGA